MDLHCMFDDTALYSILLQRLTDVSDMNVSMCLDNQMFSEGKPPCGRGRVRRLQAGGAKVFLCKGLRRYGSYHVKEIVFDRRVFFTGSANLTTASHNNQERGYRMTGTVVAEALADISAETSRATQWYP